MSMIVNTNLASINAQKNLSSVTMRLQGNYSRLGGFGGQGIDEGAFAGSWRTGDANQVRAARLLIDPPDECRGFRSFVLDERNCPGNGARVAGKHAVV